MYSKQSALICLLFLHLTLCEGNFANTREFIDVPNNCPEGQHVDINGFCVDSWGRNVIKHMLAKNGMCQLKYFLCFVLPVNFLKLFKKKFSPVLFNIPTDK